MLFSPFCRHYWPNILYISWWHIMCISRFPSVVFKYYWDLSVNLISKSKGITEEDKEEGHSPTDSSLNIPLCNVAKDLFHLSKALHWTVSLDGFIWSEYLISYILFCYREYGSTLNNENVFHKHPSWLFSVHIVQYVVSFWSCLPTKVNAKMLSGKIKHNHLVFVIISNVFPKNTYVIRSRLLVTVR